MVCSPLSGGAGLKAVALVALCLVLFVSRASAQAATVWSVSGGEAGCARGATKIEYASLSTNGECLTNSMTSPYKVMIECYDDCSWRYTHWPNGATYPNQNCSVFTGSVPAAADICGENLGCVELPSATCSHVSVFLKVECKVCDIPKPSNTCNSCPGSWPAWNEASPGTTGDSGAARRAHGNGILFSLTVGVVYQLLG